MGDLDQRIDLATLLVIRMERLSVDSYWAHRASGLRGSLLRSLEQIASNPDVNVQNDPRNELEHLDQLIKSGFEILENAAREIHA